MRIDLNSIGINETTFKLISDAVDLSVRVEASQAGLKALATVEEKNPVSYDILDGEQMEQTFDWSMPANEIGYAVINMVHKCYDRFLVSHPELKLTRYEWSL